MFQICFYLLTDPDQAWSIRFRIPDQIKLFPLPIGDKNQRNKTFKISVSQIVLQTLTGQPDTSKSLQPSNMTVNALSTLKISFFLSGRNLGSPGSGIRTPNADPNTGEANLKGYTRIRIGNTDFFTAYILKQYLWSGSK